MQSNAKEMWICLTPSFTLNFAFGSNFERKKYGNIGENCLQKGENEQ